MFVDVFEALVFNTENGDMDSETIPKYVSYKIRMDISRVDSTNKFKVKDRSVSLHMLLFFCCFIHIVISCVFLAENTCVIVEFLDNFFWAI